MRSRKIIIGPPLPVPAAQREPVLPPSQSTHSVQKKKARPSSSSNEPLANELKRQLALEQAKHAKLNQQHRAMLRILCHKLNKHIETLHTLEQSLEGMVHGIEVHLLDTE